MKCNICGKDIDDNSVVCSKCGAPVYNQSNINQGYGDSQMNMNQGYNPQQNMNQGYNPQQNMNQGYNPQMNMNPGYNPQGYAAKPPVKGLSAVATLGSILLNLVMFGAIFWLFFAIILRSVVSGGGVRAMVDSNEFREEVMEDAFYGYNINGRDMDELEDFFDGETELFADTIEDSLNYYMTGKGDPIDVDQWMDFIEDNQDEIEDAVGEKITDDDLDEIREALEEANEDAKEQFDEESEDIVALKVIGRFFSIWNVIIPGLLIAVCIGLNILVTRPYINKALNGNGITGLIAGILSLGVTGLISLLKTMAEDVEVIENLIGYLGGVALVTSVIIIVVSIAAIVAGGVLKKSVMEKVDQL